MSESRDEFRSLMRQVQQGSPEATQRLIDLCGPHVIQAVRRKLAKRLRAQFDSDDFLQDVWASFFAELPDQHAFDQPEKVIAHLAKMAKHKVLDAYRQRYLSVKRDREREQGVDSTILDPRNETPSQMALAQDQWDYLLKTQPLHYRPILVLLRQGYQHEQIARELGMNVSTIRRFVARLAAKVP